MAYNTPNWWPFQIFNYTILSTGMETAWNLSVSELGNTDIMSVLRTEFHT